MRARSQAVLVGLLLLSSLVHLAVWFGLGQLPPVEEMMAATMEMEVVEVVPEPEPEVPEPEAPEPEPEVPEPEPEVVEPPEPPPEPRPRPEPQAPQPTPEPAPEEPPQAEPPPPAEEAIADFTGETLTNDEGPAWQSATGSGAPIEGRIGQPGAQVTGRRRRGVQGGTPGGEGEAEPGPRVVDASDLAQPVRPPSERLAELLRRNYPRRAHDLGVEGRAVVRVRIEPDGRPRPLAVIRESYEGFGDACRRTIRQGGRWTPPRDRQGREVATVVNFACTFTIRF